MKLPNFYDADTICGLSNSYGLTEKDLYWVGRKGYCGYEYDKMYTSSDVCGYHYGTYYLALVKDNKIIAFGSEQGNYAGGIYCANDYLYFQFLEEKESLKKHYPNLYKQIKDIPLAGENEYPNRD